MSGDSALLAKRDAPLPVRYEAAKRELAECERVDECATWAKKAAALASYARQADDKTLEQTAVRIRARAIRRCGELLTEIPAKAGKIAGESYPHRSERAQAAKDAGLSSDQTKDALRIAKVPPDEFESAVESDNPPTIEDLAERGTKKTPLVDIQGRDPEAYNRSLSIRGALHELTAMARDTGPEIFFGGCVPRHYDQMRDDCSVLTLWLTLVRKLLMKELVKGDRSQ